MNPAPARRYWDNAATTFPKPPGVTAAVCAYLEEIGASAGRGAYREASASRQVLDDCRDAVRAVLRARPADHVIFTLNGTDGLNLGIKALVRPGEHVVTTAMDHNSVLRPLAALAEQWGVQHTIVAADPQTTLINPADVVAALRPDTRLVVISHASNVTGALQPIAEIGAACRARGVWVFVDAAQSAGHVPLSFADLPIDLLAAPGHKGLLGPLGTGVLLIRAGVEEHMRTVREGGTGSESERPVQPAQLPDRFEAGSHNAVGLAGLLAALRWLKGQTVERLHAAEQRHTARLLAGWSGCRGLTVFGPRDPAQRVGVFSVRLAGYDPQELSALLEQRFGLLTRGGLHCAPLAHRTIGTDRDGGTTRFALGPFLTDDDVDAAVAALVELSRHAPVSTVAATH
jgi:cysteine desulfurase family protein